MNPGKSNRELVRVISDPHKGRLYGRWAVSAGANEWLTLTEESYPIEGVVLKALAGNAGTIYVTGIAANQNGFPLAAGEAVSIATDNLLKVKVWVPTAGDGAGWLVFEQARD
ncbi:MAG: hypothetical protein ACUVX1_15720 [Chloroflexota bacterium]